MQRLKSALEREYENDPDTKITVHNPKNTMSVDLYFTGEKTVKVKILKVFCKRHELLFSLSKPLKAAYPHVDYRSII